MVSKMPLPFPPRGIGEAVHHNLCGRNHILRPQGISLSVMQQLQDQNTIISQHPQLLDIHCPALDRFRVVKDALKWKSRRFLSLV